MGHVGDTGVGVYSHLPEVGAQGGRAGPRGHEGASAVLPVSSLLALASHRRAGAESVEMFLPRANRVAAHTCCLKILLNCWHWLADIPLFSDNSDSKLNWLQGASAALYSNKGLMPANGWSLSSPRRAAS